MTRRKKPNGLPPVNVTPTKRKAILMYHDREGKSFHWIANHADEFKDTAVPESPDELWEIIQEVWYSDHFNDYVKNLYQSMPRRMDALLRSEGKWTKY